LFTKKKLFLIAVLVIAGSLATFFLVPAGISNWNEQPTKTVTGKHAAAGEKEEIPVSVEKPLPVAVPSSPETTVEKEPVDRPVEAETGLPSGNSGNVNWDDFPLDKLFFLQSPIPGAGITSRDSQLPGAPRHYRNGTHQGLDFYSGYCGVPVKFGDPVFAAGPGVVYRIDHHFEELDPEEREELLSSYCREKGETPEEVLDLLRGRQVWLLHPHGIMTRYAHLDQVSDELQVGDPVKKGDKIGTVGNSGTNDGARGNHANAHLHFEIWVGESFLGEGLTPGEIREIWHQVLLQEH